jgi:hypothetical protein
MKSIEQIRNVTGDATRKNGKLAFCTEKNLMVEFRISTRGGVGILNQTISENSGPVMSHYVSVHLSQEFASANEWKAERRRCTFILHHVLDLIVKQTCGRNWTVTMGHDAFLN